LTKKHFCFHHWRKCVRINKGERLRETLFQNKLQKTDESLNKAKKQKENIPSVRHSQKGISSNLNKKYEPIRSRNLGPEKRGFVSHNQPKQQTCCSQSMILESSFENSNTNNISLMNFPSILEKISLQQNQTKIKPSIQKSQDFSFLPSAQESQLNESSINEQLSKDIRNRVVNFVCNFLIAQPIEKDSFPIYEESNQTKGQIKIPIPLSKGNGLKAPKRKSEVNDHKQNEVVLMKQKQKIFEQKVLMSMEETKVIKKL